MSSTTGPPVPEPAVVAPTVVAPTVVAPTVVALGGGHGLAASLRALRTLTGDLTAVVTVADDGGSSGRLRRDLDVLPPGDLRMALAALAGDDEWAGTWSRLFQHRYDAGPLAGHAVGNLVMVGLAAVLGSELAALDYCGRLLGVRGRVLPMTTERIEIVAQVTGLATADAIMEVRGQHEVATTTGRVRSVELVPRSPAACTEAVAAVLAAQFVVLGPGSLFTSVLPHLLVPELRDAIVKTPAEVILSLNLSPQTGETFGFSPQAHLEALRGHVPDLRLDHVIADTSVLDRDGLMTTTAELGGLVRFTEVASRTDPARHDPVLLAAAYRDIIGPTEHP
ncbi:MAG: uridine diphosphate-N-acetylglucosamine-binding protein YvcK [Mycobacteriales bacterium]